MKKLVKLAITCLLAGLLIFSAACEKDVFGGKYKEANEEERKAAVEKIAEAADREERQFNAEKAPDDQRNKQMDFNVSFKRGREFWCWTKNYSFKVLYDVTDKDKPLISIKFQYDSLYDNEKRPYEHSQANAEGTFYIDVSTSTFYIDYKKVQSGVKSEGKINAKIDFRNRYPVDTDISEVPVGFDVEGFLSGENVKVFVQGEDKIKLQITFFKDDYNTDKDLNAYLFFVFDGDDYTAKFNMDEQFKVNNEDYDFKCTIEEGFSDEKVTLPDDLEYYVDQVFYLDSFFELTFLNPKV